MEKLSTREYRDISEHACQRIARDLGDALQLIDDPEQAARLACNVAMAMLGVASDVVGAAYRDRTGKKMPRRVVMAGILEEVMRREGIEFKEVEQL